MSNPPPRQPDAMGAVTQLVDHLRLAWLLIQDARVPLVTKLIPVAVLIYVLSPIDLIPDFIPVLGQLDDIGVTVLGLNWFVHMCPPSVVQEHRRALGMVTDEVIDAEYRVVEDQGRR